MDNRKGYVKNSAEVQASAKNIVKVNGVMVQGKSIQLKACSNAKLAELMDSMSDEELTLFVTSLGWTEDYVASAPTSENHQFDPTGEDMVDFTTKDGTVVKVLNLEYVGTSGNANFKFKMNNGSFVTHTGDRLRRLHSAGGLKKGDIIPFKPESIKASSNPGEFHGIPNYSASENLRRMEEYSTENLLAIKARRAELRGINLSEEAIDKIIVQEFGGAENSMVVKPKRPTFN